VSVAAPSVAPVPATGQPAGKGKARYGDNGQRKRQLAEIHIGAQQLRWTREEYEDVMATVCAGIRSAALLDLTGRLRFMSHIQACLRANGRPVPAAAKADRPKLKPRQAKLWGLWMQLCDAGQAKVRSMSALDAWCQRQTQVQRMLWCNDAQLDLCIESAKRWLKRGGAE
jgi:hypothetical protein